MLNQRAEVSTYWPNQKNLFVVDNNSAVIPDVAVQYRHAHIPEYPRSLVIVEKLS